MELGIGSGPASLARAIQFDTSRLREVHFADAMSSSWQRTLPLQGYRDFLEMEDEENRSVATNIVVKGKGQNTAKLLQRLSWSRREGN